MTGKILRRAQVEEKTGLKTSTIYQKMSNNTFPRPIKLGVKSVGWIESEINNWLSEKILARDHAALSVSR